MGSKLTFSVKPEDVVISDSHAEGEVVANVVSIIHQVGSFKVILDLNGIPIIALTYDEDLVKRLRSNGSKVVTFSFRKDSTIILSD